MIRRLDCISVDDNRVKFIGLGQKGLMLVDQIRDLNKINTIGIVDRDREISSSIFNLIKFDLDSDRPDSYEFEFYQIENNLREALRDNGKVAIVVGDLSEPIVSGSIQSLTQYIQELNLSLISMLFSERSIGVDSIGRFQNISGSHYIHIDSVRLGERSFESRFLSVARMLQDCESGVITRYSLDLGSFKEVLDNNRSCEIELLLDAPESDLELNRLIFIKTKTALSRSVVYGMVSNLTSPDTNFSWGYKVDEKLSYGSEFLVIKGAK